MSDNKKSFIGIGVGIALVAVVAVSCLVLILTDYNNNTSNLTTTEKIETKNISTSSMDSELINTTSIVSDKLAVHEIKGKSDILVKDSLVVSGNVSTSGFIQSGNVKFPTTLGSTGQVLQVTAGSTLEFSTTTGAVTNLTHTTNAETVEVQSSSGESTILPTATSSSAGVMSAAQVSNLSNTLSTLMTTETIPNDSLGGNIPAVLTRVDSGSIIIDNFNTDICTGVTPTGLNYIKDEGMIENTKSQNSLAAVGYNSEYIFTYDVDSTTNNVVNVTAYDLQTMAATNPTASPIPKPGANNYEIDTKYGIQTAWIPNVNVVCYVNNPTSTTRQIIIQQNEGSYLKSISNSYNLEVSVLGSPVTDLKCVRMKKLSGSSIGVLVISVSTNNNNTAVLYSVSRGESQTLYNFTGTWLDHGDFTVDEYGNIYVTLMNSANTIELLISNDHGKTFSPRNLTAPPLTKDYGNYKVSMANKSGLIRICTQSDIYTDNKYYFLIIDIMGHGLGMVDIEESKFSSNQLNFYEAITLPDMVVSPVTEYGAAPATFTFYSNFPMGKIGQSNLPYNPNILTPVTMGAGADVMSTKMAFVDNVRGVALFPFTTSDFPIGMLALLSKTGSIVNRDRTGIVKMVGKI